MRFLGSNILGPTCLLAVAGYFLYHMIVGNHGVQAWSAVEAQLQNSRFELKGLQVQQKALEHQVSLLRPESLCPDLLEEQARKILGVVRRDEIVVIRPDDLR